MSKVAILMIGNLRSYNNTFKNLEAHLLQHYNCDLYITTYDKRFNMKFGGFEEENVTEEQIRNTYGKYIKSITIIQQENFIDPYLRVKNKEYKFGNELDRLYTIHKLAMIAYDVFRGECFRNNRQYDMVLKLRPDLLLNEKLNINMSIKDNQIVVPSNNSGGCFNDHLAYGKLNAMTRYLTYFRTFHEIDRRDDGNPCDVSIIEDGLKKNLEVYHLEIIRDCIRYTIIRDIKQQKVVYFGKGQYYVRKYNQ